MGLIAENGDSFYAELTDYDPHQIDTGCRRNVDNLVLKDKTR
jgi:hypothetical protein